MWCSWGVALIELKRFEEASEKFQKAVELSPDFVSALYGWGFALIAMGRKAEAAEKFREAAKIAPNTEEGRF